MTVSITIQTEADFTPAGKRRVKIVRHKKNGKKSVPMIAWYVGAKLFRHLDLTNENIALSEQWKA